MVFFLFSEGFPSVFFILYTGKILSFYHFCG